MAFSIRLNRLAMDIKRAQNSSLFFDNRLKDVILFYPKYSNWMFLPLKPPYGFTDRSFYRSSIALTNLSLDPSLSAQLIGLFRKSA